MEYEKKKRIQELEEQIADLKSRMPAHSVKPAMFQQMETLEEEMGDLKRNLKGYGELEKSFEEGSRSSIKLEELLKERYPGEENHYLAKVLLEVSERDMISYNEIDIPKEIKEELLLFTYIERLVIPVKTLGSMQWNHRLLTFEDEALFEMPNVVRYLVQGANEHGEWNTAYAVKEYLKEIGEERVEDITKLVEKLKKTAKDKRITSETVKRASSELNIKFDLNKTIAELKGGGIISPTLPNISKRFPSYEINPALY
jgi:hypothetical protein